MQDQFTRMFSSKEELLAWIDEAKRFKNPDVVYAGFRHEKNIYRNEWDCFPSSWKIYNLADVQHLYDDEWDIYFNGCYFSCYGDLIKHIHDMTDFDERQQLDLFLTRLEGDDLFRSARKEGCNR